MRLDCFRILHYHPYMRHSIAPGSTSFMILFALAAGPLSGSEIQQQIIADNVGEYVKSTTLYQDLRRLEAKGYVELVGEQGAERFFELTKDGSLALERGVKLLKILTTLAMQRRI